MSYNHRKPDHFTVSTLADPTPDASANWAGVPVNEVARPALVLNAPVDDGARPSHPPGEPGYLSLRLLSRDPPVWAVANRFVYVCETPNRLAIAADRLGSRCHPLVCPTEYQPLRRQPAAPFDQE